MQVDESIEWKLAMKDEMDSLLLHIHYMCVE